MDRVICRSLLAPLHSKCINSTLKFHLESNLDYLKLAIVSEAGYGKLYNHKSNKRYRARRTKNEKNNEML